MAVATAAPPPRRVPVECKILVKGEGMEKGTFPIPSIFKDDMQKTFLSHLINLHPKDQKISGDFFSCLQILQKKHIFYKNSAIVLK